MSIISRLSKEDELAAEAILAEAGPEKIRRFRAQFDDVCDDMPMEEPASSPPKVERLSDRIEGLEGTGLESQRPVAQSLDEIIDGLAASITAKNGGKDLEHCKKYLNELVKSTRFKNQVREIEDMRPKLARLCDELEAADEAARDLRFDFRLHLSVDELLEALRFKTIIVQTIKDEKMIKANGKGKLKWTMPATNQKRKLLVTLIEWLLDSAAAAHHIGSAAGKDWKAAYLLVFRAVGGPDATDEAVSRPLLDQKKVNRLKKLIYTAHYNTFVDAAAVSRAEELWGAQ